MANLYEKFLLIVLVCFTLTAGQNLNYRQLRQLYNTRVRSAQALGRDAATDSKMNFNGKFRLIGLLCFALTNGQFLSSSQLRQLYNTRVTSAQRFKRPMGSGWLQLPSWIPHTGVVVTTVDGGRWLIHKGNGYGVESETVVTKASHMSSKWKPDGSRQTIRTSTIGDYVAAGKAGYNLLLDNCWSAARRMMRLN